MTDNKKDAWTLTWVFFASHGIKDNADLIRCNILCMEICRQGESATVESIKETGAYKGCGNDIPDWLLTDEKIQEMINWKL